MLSALSCLMDENPRLRKREKTKGMKNRTGRAPRQEARQQHRRSPRATYGVFFTL